MSGTFSGNYRTPLFIRNDTKLSHWNPYIQENQGRERCPCDLFLEVPYREL